MVSLLHHVISAHGGLDIWTRYSDFVTDIEVNGSLCRRDGLAGITENSRLLLSIREQRTITLLPNGEGLLVAERGKVSYLNGYAGGPGERTASRPSVGSSKFRTGYFMGHMIRYAVLAPFVYAGKGFVTQEVEPWSEGGESWRVLKVTFPGDHSVPFEVQYAYYGEDGLLRRTRNCGSFFGPDLGIVNYVASYMTLDGIKIPQNREVFLCDDAGQKTDENPVARINLSNSFFTD